MHIVAMQHLLTSVVNIIVFVHEGLEAPSFLNISILNIEFVLDENNKKSCDIRVFVYYSHDQCFSQHRKMVYGSIHLNAISSNSFHYVTIYFIQDKKNEEGMKAPKH
jgi:hypothetical protein